MEIKNLVEYQKVDSKLFQLEKQLTQSANKQKCAQLSAIAKESQQKSEKLESQASQIAKEIQNLFAVADQNKLKIKEILGKDLEKLSAEELDSALSLKEKLMQNLVVLDKKATKLAEMANAVLAEFNKTKVAYKNAGEKFKQFKEAYDKEVEDVSPKINELKKELAIIEKNIDKNLLEEYAKRRRDRIFPVLVPLNNRCCGGCHMEVPASSVSKLEREGILVCENCRRIIFKI